MFRTNQSSVLQHHPLEDNNGSVDSNSNGSDWWSDWWSGGSGGSGGAGGGGNKSRDIRASIEKKKQIEDTMKQTAIVDQNMTSLSHSASFRVFRNRSNETYSTAANSSMCGNSGLYSIEEEIYSSCSEAETETESELFVEELEATRVGTIQDDDEDEQDTTVHMNNYVVNNNAFMTKGVNNDEEEDQEVTVGRNLSFFNLVYNNVLKKPMLTNKWDEERPFDEESLKALSEESIVSDNGDNSIETIYAISPLVNKEYILPPVVNDDDDDVEVGVNYIYSTRKSKSKSKSLSSLSYDNVLQKSTSVTTKNNNNNAIGQVVVRSAVSTSGGNFLFDISDDDDDEESLSPPPPPPPSIQISKRAHNIDYDNNNDNTNAKNKTKNKGREKVITRSYCLIVWIIVITLLVFAAAILVGFFISQKRNMMNNDTTTEYNNNNNNNNNNNQQPPIVSSVLEDSSAASTDNNIFITEEDPPLNTPPPPLPRIPTTIFRRRPPPWSDIINKEEEEEEEQQQQQQHPTIWGDTHTFVDPISEAVYPLSLCEGHCDNDDDCAVGLICFQQSMNSDEGDDGVVPFCRGGETNNTNTTTRTDYCIYDPNADTDTDTDTDIDTNASIAYTSSTNANANADANANANVNSTSDGSSISGSTSEEIPITEIAIETETVECSNSITVTPDCFSGTENVIVVNFLNCLPHQHDWIGIYATRSPTRYVEATDIVWIGNEYIIDWAYTCGEQQQQKCSTHDSPPSTSYSFAFATNKNTDFDRFNLRAYLLRGPAPNRGLPYQVIAKSEAFVTTQVCQ